MSVVLDAYALVAYFREEPAADAVQRVLWEERTHLSAVQAAEVIDRMSRVYGADPDELEVIITALGITVEPLDAALAVRAGRLRARYHRPTGRTLSLADSCCVALALELGMPVLTADPVLLEVLRTAGGVGRPV